jgi:hypothetical protein
MVRAQFKEAGMKNTVRLSVLALILAFCAGSALAHPVSKRKKIVVNVQLDGNCPQGISLTGDILGDRELCVNAPEGAGHYFQRYVGSDIEVEAQWTFEGNPTTDAPVNVGKILRIGREKVNVGRQLGKL